MTESGVIRALREAEFEVYDEFCKWLRERRDNGRNELSDAEISTIATKAATLARQKAANALFAKSGVDSLDSIPADAPTKRDKP